MADQTQQWGANQLRLTAFPTPTATLDGSGWWEKLTGESPETAVTNTRTATREFTGQLQGGALILQIQPLRLNWLHSASVLEGGPTLTGTLGPFFTAVQPFLDLMTKWLAFPDAPPIQRIAFGAVLLMPVESREAGYEKLASYLPFVKLDPSNSSDFLYQINRPRPSTVVQLQINRLSKWAVGAFQALLATQGGIALAGKEYAIRLELDINTTPENAEQLPPEKLPSLFNELGSFATEIAEKGDIL